MKPFRFLAGPPEATDGDAIAAAAREAEAIGYAAFVYPDHVVSPLGMVPVLAWAAAATQRLRVAPFVANNDLRHPALLAQDLATLDVLSGGRVEAGIGAGWNRPEYDALGLTFDAVGRRVDRLTEAVTVLKGCFADGPFDFSGVHYTVSAHDAIPKPVQRPHPPLFIGGGGRRLLTLAGREADIVGLAPRTLASQAAGGPVRSDPRSITVAATAEKIGWVREAAGERFGSLELNTYPSGISPQITDHARKVATDAVDGIRARTGVEITVDEFLESPHVLVGSVAGLVEKLRGLREQLGISSIMTGDVRTLAPVVERLAGT